MKEPEPGPGVIGCCVCSCYARGIQDATFDTYRENVKIVEEREAELRARQDVQRWTDR